MKLRLPNIKTIRPIINWFRQYGSFVVSILILLLFIWMVSRINIYSRREPNETELAERLKGVKKPKIDDEIVAKIEDLKDNNIQVQAIFDKARENPFSE